LVPFWRLKKGLAVRAKPPEAPTAATDMHPKPTAETKDQKIAAFGSSYKGGSKVVLRRFEGGSKARRQCKKKRPEPVGAFLRGCGLGFTAV
jgi:hypothetical protein